MHCTCILKHISKRVTRSSLFMKREIKLHIVYSSLLLKFSLVSSDINERYDSTSVSFCSFWSFYVLQFI